MVTAITVLHILVCLFLILTVLLQAGKGGGMGVALGGGTSNTVFGSSGAGNFLQRLTAVTAVVFMLTSLTLAYFASAKGSEGLRGYSERARKQADAKAEAKKKQDEQAKLVGDAGPASSPEVLPVAPENTPPAPAEGAPPAAPVPAAPAAPTPFAAPPAPPASLPPAPKPPTAPAPAPL